MSKKSGRDMNSIVNRILYEEEISSETIEEINSLTRDSVPWYLEKEMANFISKINYDSSFNEILKAIDFQIILSKSAVNSTEEIFDKFVIYPIAELLAKFAINDRLSDADMTKFKSKCEHLKEEKKQYIFLRNGRSLEEKIFHVKFCQIHR